MKYLLLLAFILCPTACSAYEVYSKHVHLVTDKVSHITGMIDPKAAAAYYVETTKTLSLPGPRVIVIDSLGGYLDSGQQIIDMMEAEKAHGVRLVCVVQKEATSMAFNILTHCDIRLASPKARFLVHNAALGGWDSNERATAKNLRKEANMLDRENQPYRDANCTAMHLTLKEYDDAADEEKTWTTQELIKIGYLSGYVK